MAYRGLQEIQGGTEDIKVDSVLFYPVIQSEDEKEDLLNRLAWYIPEKNQRKNFSVFMPLSEGGLEESDHELTTQARYNNQHLNLEFIAKDEIHTAAHQADVILIWNAKCQFSLKIFKHLKKTRIVDPRYFSAVEIDRWIKLSNMTGIDKDDKSKSLYKKLERRNENCDKAYIFARGPSLKHAYDYEFDDSSINIICNGIVRDRELLTHINPDVLAAADPILFGPSKYGHQFRNDARNAMKKYEMATIIPPKYHALASGHFPNLEFIALPSARSENPIFPTSTNLKVKATANIMTLFMLPIASALADEVYIIGADGIKNSESSSFDHYEGAQYNQELVKSATECHPSYYRDNVFSSYYQDHIKILRNMIEYGEQQGIEYYSLTDSYIPCLAERTREGPY